MTVRYYIWIIVLAHTVTWTISCIQLDELPDVELARSEPTLAVPIAQVRILSQDLVAQLDDDIELGLNSEGVYTAHIHADTFVQSRRDLFPQVTIPFPIPILDTVSSLPFPTMIDANITRAVIEGETLIFSLNSTEPSEVSVMIRIDQLVKDGEPLVKEYTIPGNNGALSNLVTEPIDLHGYEVDLTSGSIQLVYDARNDKGERITLALSFAQIDTISFSHLEGTVGRSALGHVQASVPIDLQDTLIKGSYKFTDPKIIFSLRNSFGVPIGINVQVLNVVFEDSSRISLKSPLLDDIISINYPPFDQMGRTAFDEIDFDQHNSNLEEVLTNEVIAVEYDFEIIANPLGDGNLPFFVVDTSMLQVDTKFELSFDANINAIQVEQSVGISLDSLDRFSSIELKLVADNALPLAFDLELSARDTVSDQVVVFPSAEGGLLSAAKVDEGGTVIEATRSVVQYGLEDAEILHLSKSHVLIAKIVVSSPQMGTMRAIIKPDQGLDLGIGAILKVSSQ